jgi:hypothetical protein
MLRRVPPEALSGLGWTPSYFQARARRVSGGQLVKPLVKQGAVWVEY